MIDVRVLQVASDDAEPVAARIARVTELIRAQAGANLIVLPELWATGFLNFDRYAHDADEFAAELKELGANLATELNCTVHLGSITTRDASGGVRNTSLIYEPGTKAQAPSLCYDKIHPFANEKDYVERGSAIPENLTLSSGLQLTTNICFDLRFAGLWDEQRRRGAELFINSAAWALSRAPHRAALLRARAIEQQSFVIGSDSTGTQSGTEFSGHSMVISPTGEIIAAAESRAEQVVRAQLDPLAVAEARANFPIFDRRLDSYRDI
ncbi:nitrilase-related carbon-nitrogen hydrolase [Canibacter zhoujuaniae]|uniref:nitrilase-related carbon-nitrogen hydrolase n=1 Tax=Canibacter zhoujuaniae TaxID=2708343 RepID=UPI00141DFC43|nr:nitrilase-related carbon-nitrogen hydrolase [Canibacter zhoujuaniae]